MIIIKWHSYVVVRITNLTTNCHLSTVAGDFIGRLDEIGREDAARVLLNGCSLYRIITVEESMDPQVPSTEIPMPKLSNDDDVKGVSVEVTDVEKRSRVYPSKLSSHTVNMNEQSSSTVEKIVSR